MKLKNLVPMLNVSDIEKSLQFYSRAFGFEVASDPKAIEEWKWATIRSGETQLMLSESGGAPNLRAITNPYENVDWPCIYYFYPEDVESLYQHVLSEGFKPTELETTFYGMKEFSIRDPDGHLLSFGQDNG